MNPVKAYAHLFSPGRPDATSFGTSSGQITFMRGAHVPLTAQALNRTKARYAFVGVPFEEGNVGRPGCAEGPLDFRLASHEFFPYWFEYQVDLYGSVVDCGDVLFAKVDPDAAYERIYKAVREILAAGLTPIVCGGDRSISVPAARALSDHIGRTKRMGCLHFGATLDMADSWAGRTNVGPCAMARITELSNVKPGNVAAMGVRNSMNPKDHFDLAASRGIKVYAMSEMLKKGVDRCVGEAIDRVWNGTHAQYLSFNFNVMDASDAPGVTMAEPGGLESREMMRIADMLGRKKSVSVIDITELAPVFDVCGTTSRLAACTVLRTMAALAGARGETVDPKIRRKVS